MKNTLLPLTPRDKQELKSEHLKRKSPAESSKELLDI